MDRYEDMRRTAKDRGVPGSDRVTAISELAKVVESDLASRAELWRNVWHPILFDESEDDAVRVAVARGAAVLGEVVVNNLCGTTSPDKPEIRRAIVATLHEVGRRPLTEYFETRLREDIAKLEHE